MESKFYCTQCDCSFTRKYIYTQHMKSKKHLKRSTQTDSMYLCACGRTYSHKKSLDYHQKTCSEPKTPASGKTIRETVDEMRVQLQTYEKEREELKAQIESILEKGSAVTPAPSNMQHIETQNIETQNNITININAFGQENVEYLSNNAIADCINRVYKSIPAIIRHIHFDPNHPENHNVKITNKKLPYASVMGNNNKWCTMNKKDIIETMMINGYNLLDEKYPETKGQLSSQRQQHFEGFMDRFENEDKDLRKQVKTDVELLVLNSGEN